MRITLLSSVAAVWLAAGCTGDSTSRVDSQGTRVHPVEKCGCKISGTGIGKEGIYAHIGSTVATFGHWVPKPGAPGEYVGFTLFIDGAPSVGYVVNAAGETYASHSLTWFDPNGADGANAPAITNVDLCVDCPSGDCGPDTTCQDPDGCPDGGSGSGSGSGSGGTGGTGCDNPDGCPDPNGGSGPIL